MSDRRRLRRAAAATVLGCVAVLGCSNDRPAARPPALVPAVTAETTTVDVDRHVSGRLVDTLGQPVADGVVVLLGARDRAESRSDALGAFRVGLPDDPGPFVLVVTHPRFPPRVLDVGPHRELGDVALQSAIGCTIEVSRIDPPGPVPDARVRIEPVLYDPRLPDRAILARSATSGSDGRAELYGVRPGTYQLRIEAPGLVSIEQAHVQPATPGAPPQIHVRMTPGHRVVGRAVRPDGSPAARARVDAFVGERGSPSGTAWTGEDGDFRLTNLGAGPVRLRAVLEPDLVGETRSPSEPRDEAVLIRLERPGPLTGRVVDAATGETVAGALVRAAHATPSPVPLRFEVRTDGVGRFTFPDVMAGRWDILATSNRHVPARIGPLELPTTAPPELRLARAATVTGTVFGASGRPQPGAMIDVMPASFDGSALAPFGASAGSTGVRRAAPDGSFALRTSTAPVRLVVRAPGHAAFLSAPIDPSPGPGDHPAPVSIRLERGTLVCGTAGRADGTPASGAWVCADPVGTGDGPLRLGARSRVADDGRFELGPLSAGPYEVFYYSADRERTAGDLAGQVAATRVQLDVAGDAPIECNLIPR